jgi:hypothetical protein
MRQQRLSLLQLPDIPRDVGAPRSPLAASLMPSSVYQEYLAKTLTENYGNLSQQMDKLILEANSEIKSLQDKLQGGWP